MRKYYTEKELSPPQVVEIFNKVLVYILPWAFGSSFDIKIRKKIADLVYNNASVESKPNIEEYNLIDFMLDE